MKDTLKRVRRAAKNTQQAIRVAEQEVARARQRAGLAIEQRLQALEREQELQFRRMAQMQANLDLLNNKLKHYEAVHGVIE